LTYTSEQVEILYTGSIYLSLWEALTMIRRRKTYDYLGNIFHTNQTAFSIMALVKVSPSLYLSFSVFLL
jgi:hypothetical protein